MFSECLSEILIQNKQEINGELDIPAYIGIRPHCWSRNVKKGNPRSNECFRKNQGETCFGPRDLYVTK